MAASKALTTSKKYETSIGFLYHTRMFLLFLLGHANESELKRATVATDAGLSIKPGKASMIPANFFATCAKNTTGRCETVRVFNAHSESILRFAFSSPTFKYQGWNAGEGLIKKMAGTLGLPDASLMQVQQGKKAYYWNTDMVPLHNFCIAFFHKLKENK